MQRKAKEIGLDLDNLPPANAPRAAPRAPDAPPPSPMAPADWNPRFVRGRTVPGFEFMQNQRRRYVLVAKWGEFMKDLDLFIGSPTADIGAECADRASVRRAAVQVRRAAAAGAVATTTMRRTPTLNPQPICGVITGALYNDDMILAVAHRFQQATDFHLRRPSL